MMREVDVTKDILEEFKAIMFHWLMWFTLGNQDIKLRYRRSSIGPFWITLSMAVTISALGFLYSRLFGVDLQSYLPYLAISLICWALVSTLIIESCNGYVEAENFIRNQQTAFSIYIMRLLLRNIIIFAHNILVFIPIAIMYDVPVSWRILLIIPGFILLGLNAVLWGGVLAILGTRYRDFTQIATSLVQVIFFMTPIMWMPSFLNGHHQWLILYNPFNQLLNLIRNPLLNQDIGLHAWSIVGLMAVVGLSLYIYFMRKYKHRIVFWL
jgi:ABC-type polysaccharide/polyol phosphate export permease